MRSLRVLSILGALALGYGLSSSASPDGDAGSRELSAFYSATEDWIPFAKCDVVVGNCVPSSLRTCMETEGGCLDRMPWEPPQAP
jgi:hypothetical protein